MVSRLGVIALWIFPLRREVLLQGQLTKSLSLTIIPSPCLRSRVSLQHLMPGTETVQQCAPCCCLCCCCCCCRRDKNVGPGRLCLYLSLNALPVVGRAAETLTCLCHAGIRFLRPHLPPCCFCKHFRMPNSVGRTDKHMDFIWKRALKLNCALLRSLTESASPVY